jgi:predicted transcriptional regulator
MKIREIMSTDVKQIDSSATIRETAERMKKFDIGCLPVKENNKIVGIITDRDIVIRAVVQGEDPNNATITSFYTPEVFCCSQDDELADAVKLMEDAQIRRLVVLDQDNQAVGVISAGDVALRSNEEHLTWQVMEKVCERTH